jgi:hypothetical protein
VTLSDALLITSALAFAALLGIAAAAWRRRRPQPRQDGREAETRPPRLWLRLVRRLVFTLRYGPQPAGIEALLTWTPPARKAPAPLVHTGATEEFVRELRGLHDMPVAPELAPVLSEVEIRADVHADLDAMMDAFRFDLDHILDGVCRRLDPYWARCDASTGEYPVVEVRELVAA